PLHGRARADHRIRERSAPRHGPRQRKERARHAALPRGRGGHPRVLVGGALAAPRAPALAHLRHPRRHRVRVQRTGHRGARLEAHAAPARAHGSRGLPRHVPRPARCAARGARGAGNARACTARRRARRAGLPIPGGGVSTLPLALGLGLAAGAHTATWGMYKDAPHEGFTWRRYARSILLSGAIAPALHLALGLDPTHAAGAVVLFGLTYACERGLVEFYKTFLREPDQSKYTIPMQFAVFGRVVESRRARYTVGAAVAALALALAAAVWRLPQPESPPARWLVLAAAGSAGGWFSAFGGAWKDAPIEGFDWFKFFRSPGIALGWALVISRFAGNYLLI